MLLSRTPSLASEAPKTPKNAFRPPTCATSSISTAQCILSRRAAQLLVSLSRCSSSSLPRFLKAQGPISIGEARPCLPLRPPHCSPEVSITFFPPFTSTSRIAAATQLVAQDESGKSDQGQALEGDTFRRGRRFSYSMQVGRFDEDVAELRKNCSEFWSLFLLPTLLFQSKSESFTAKKAYLHLPSSDLDPFLLRSSLGPPLDLRQLARSTPSERHLKSRSCMRSKSRRAVGSHEAGGSQEAPCQLHGVRKVVSRRRSAQGHICLPYGCSRILPSRLLLHDWFRRSARRASQRSSILKLQHRVSSHSPSSTARRTCWPPSLAACIPSQRALSHPLDDRIELHQQRLLERKEVPLRTTALGPERR